MMRLSYSALWTLFRSKKEDGRLERKILAKEASLSTDTIRTNDRVILPVPHDLIRCPLFFIDVFHFGVRLFY
jgi:hypothetical protein